MGTTATAPAACHSSRAAATSYAAIDCLSAVLRRAANVVRISRGLVGIALERRNDRRHVDRRRLRLVPACLWITHSLDAAMADGSRDSSIYRSRGRGISVFVPLWLFGLREGHARNGMEPPATRKLRRPLRHPPSTQNARPRLAGERRVIDPWLLLGRC